MNLPELQAQVRQIEIRTRRLVSDLMIGPATRCATSTGTSLPA